MNLDFAAFDGTSTAQHAPTPGTSGDNGDASIHAGFSVPMCGDVLGTGGDGANKPTTRGTATHEIRVSTATRPPVSPQRPRYPAARKPNELIVSPVSPLVPGIVGTKVSDDDGFDQAAFEEGAAIMEFDGGQSRIQAAAAALSRLHEIA